MCRARGGRVRRREGHGDGVDVGPEPVLENRSMDRAETSAVCSARPFERPFGARKAVL